MAPPYVHQSIKSPVPIPLMHDAGKDYEQISFAKSSNVPWSKVRGSSLAFTMKRLKKVVTVAVIENQLQNKFPRLRPEEVEDDAGVSGSRLVRLRLLQEPGDPLREGANLQDAASLDPLLRLELVVDGQVAVGALRLEVLGQVADVKFLVLETKKGF